MKILCLIPLYFLPLINAGQQLINEVSDYNQSFDEKSRAEQKDTATATVPCTIEKNIFYSSFGTFCITVKLGDCNTKLKAELISSSPDAVFNQCLIKPNCSSSANVDGRYDRFFVRNPFLSTSYVKGPLVSDYINWGYNFPLSGLTYMNYNKTMYGPQLHNNQLGFACSGLHEPPSFFESLIDEGIISNPTLCLAVKNSRSFNSEDEAAGKLLIGKSISEVFPNSYVKFGGSSLDWKLRVAAAFISGEDIIAPSSDDNIRIDTSTPYIVMDRVSYISFLSKLKSTSGIQCLNNGPTDEGEIYVCYVDCAIESKLPRIGLTLGSFNETAPAVKYFLKNSLVKFGGQDGDGRCSLAIAGYTQIIFFSWRLGTSFFNGKTVCFESTSGVNSIYIGSSGL